MPDVSNLYVFDGEGSTVLVLTAPSLGSCSFDVASDGGTTTYPATGPLVTWSGRARDPFFIDETLLAAITDAVQHGEVVMFEDRNPERAVNTRATTTVDAVVLQIPYDVLAHGTRITVTATPDGVERVGMPLAEVYGEPESLAERVAGVVRRHGTATNPEAYGRQVAALLTPNELPYTVGTPAAFGFAGVNGRALGDNAAEVMFSLATNRAIPTGLTSRNAAASHSTTFPYVVPTPG